MPASDGTFRGISVPAEAWDRIFGHPEAREVRKSGYLARGEACPHTWVKHESHSQIPYCGDCGVDLA